MKITNSEQANQFKENEELLKRMNKGLERKIASKEIEIDGVEALYDKKILAAKAAGESDYAENLDRNQNRLIGESKVFEDKIQSYQGQLKKAQDSVAKEEIYLKGTEKEKLSQLKTQLEENYQDQYSSIQDGQQEIQNSSQASVKELATKTKVEKLNLESNAQFEINALSSEFNQKSADSESDFRNKMTSDVRLHNAEISHQRDDLKKLMSTDYEKNKRMSDEQNRVATAQTSYQDKYQQNLLKQREADFKVRYDNMVKQHDSVLKELTTRFEADVKKVVESTSKEKKIVGSKNQDPFYNVDKLEPKMLEDLKVVTVSLPVSDFEKENVHLSAQGRNIKITLSRKYAETLPDMDGSINKSTRSELFSKELTTKDLLNSKQIVQSYEDGILTFKINKA